MESRKNEVYIFGAGKYGKALGRYIKNQGILEVVGYIDNDAKKQGQRIEGIECISVEEAIKRGAQNVIVCISPIEDDEIVKQLDRLDFHHVIRLGTWWEKQKYLIPDVLEESDYWRVRPFNFYESPYPNIVDIHKREEEIFDIHKEVLEIDFNINRQCELADMMGRIDMPVWEMGENNHRLRYYYDNSFFKKGSADILYYMIQILQPCKIIEVGSGFSTAAMLDLNENYHNNKINITSIEPDTTRLRSLLRSDDNLNIIEKKLQEVPVDFFRSLGENDILFIDSSHVSKIDSDVNYLFFEIFPRLNKGVYIHFHDVFYPFTYLKHWIYEGRAYNEMYILRAFLMNNSKYMIQFWGEMLLYIYKERLPEKLIKDCTGSIWIRKEIQ